MTEWIITSSIAILLVIGLRLLLINKISNRLRYALWLLVLVRLLIPYQSGYSSLSALNYTKQITAPQENAVFSQPATELSPTPDQLDPPLAPAYPQNTQIPEKDDSCSITFNQVLTWIGILGAIGLAAAIIASNIRFTWILRASRTKADYYEPVPVYYSYRIQAPCLYGFFRPAIYLPVQCTDPVAAGHIIAHETAHYRHWDHIWSVLRSICLCIHWYNPLVWVAVWLSKADSEMASDEAAIRELGEDSRAEYGRTLIALTCYKPKLQAMLSTTTTMYGSKRSLKTRIKQIARNPKTKWIAVVLLAMAIALINLVVFTNPDPRASANAADPHFPDGGIQGSYLYTESGLYVWDYTAGETKLSSGMAVKSGIEVTANNTNQIPTLPGSACRLSLGTEIYKDTVHNRLYVKPGPEGSGLSCATFVSIMDMQPWHDAQAPAVGYYAFIHNDQLQNNLYLYFDGQGGGRIIDGNSVLPTQVTAQTIEISRYHILSYRVVGSVLSTSRGTFQYQGTILPYEPLPAQAIAPGEYRIIGEIGKDPVSSGSTHYLHINADGTGILQYMDKEYRIELQGDQLMIDGAQAQYSYNPMNAKNYITVVIDGGQAVLIFQHKDAYTAE